MGRAFVLYSRPLTEMLRAGAAPWNEHLLSEPIGFCDCDSKGNIYALMAAN
jgi:hypothetical protein